MPRGEETKERFHDGPATMWSLWSTEQPRWVEARRIMLAGILRGRVGQLSRDSSCRTKLDKNIEIDSLELLG